MIGSVETDRGVFTLDDHGRWFGPDRRTVLRLNQDYNPGAYSYPADGRYGYAAVREAARALGGTTRGLRPSPSQEEEAGKKY